jgi:Ran GTPase-activating protein 1
MIANALKENPKMKLVHFAAGRDRLENKGIAALAAVFTEMQSLEIIEVPQNGIKKDGMLALMEALKANSQSLREVHVHDNWIKGSAAEKLVEFIYRARSLEKLNISDSNMGTENAYLVIKALHDSI